MNAIPIGRERKLRQGAPYKRIENDLRRKICGGLWQMGSQIPSRQQLAREYGVDVSTVQRAVSALLSEGIVSSDGSRGTFVKSLPLREDVQGAPEPRQASISAAARAAGEKTIGVAGRFAPEIPQQLVPYVLAHALEVALDAENDVNLRFYDTFFDYAHSLPIHEAAASLLSGGLDALAVIHPEASDIAPILSAVWRTQTPFVAIPHVRLDEPISQVCIDHMYDGYQAARFFVERGITDLVFVRLGNHIWSNQRLHGARRAVQSAGLAARSLAVFPEMRQVATPDNVDEFRDLLRKWAFEALREGRMPQAVIAANDDMALEILDVALEVGSKPGIDFQLLGFDDIPAARRRGLSTLRPPLFEMGQEAARLLTSMARAGSHAEPVVTTLRSNIATRQTTR